MKMKIPFLLLAGLLAGNTIAHAGVIVGGTRLVYDGEKKEAAIGVENPDASPDLAADRETLYWLNIKSIPATQASEGGNTLQLAVNTRIKLIYRPAALKGSTPDQASAQLKWSRQGQNLTVNNPTPYYINFNTISTGGKALENVTYVAPHATATFRLPASASGHTVEWKVISDYGAISKAHQASF